MKKIFPVLLIVLLGLINNSWAEESPPKLEDFAYGFELDADGSSAIYKVMLPEDVYRYAIRKDLGDLRVFNKNREIVPHSVQRRKYEKVEADTSAVLPIFPLSKVQHELKAGYSLRIQTDSKGTIVNIDSGKADEENKVQEYIVDASRLRTLPDALVLNWSGERGGSFTTTVSVLYSNDLNNWHTIVPQATLVKLIYNNHELGNFAIQLPKTRAKYYKLSWPAGRDGVSLDSLAAEFTATKDYRNIEWKELPVSNTQNEPTVYEYDAKANLPVEKINVIFPYKNVLLDAIIRSRSDLSKEWRVRFKGLIYNMEIDGQTLSNKLINIPLTGDRYWSLETSSIEGKLQQHPQLQLGWIPHDLYFVAQGDPPFKLAYGGAGVPPPPVSTNSFFQNINAEQNNEATRPKGVIADGKGGIRKGGSIQFSQGYNKNNVSVKSAKVMNRVQLGGDIKLKPKIVLPWKRWFLWSVLVAGVVVLAWMAFNLSKQMEKQ